MAGCGNNKKFQDWSSIGQLKQNLNLSLSELQLEIDSTEPIYYYVSTSVIRKPTNGHSFLHTSCGPNFEGGILTNFTCRRDIRTWNVDGGWHNKWIAGVTGVNGASDENPNRRYLFYLMQVAEIYHSQMEIWRKESNILTQEVKQIKNATKNPFGDIFPPLPNASDDDQYCVESYQKPISNHVHYKDNKGWMKDINYPPNDSTKQQVYLVGHPKRSYLWSKPLIYLEREQNWRNRTNDNIQHFLTQLSSETK